VHPIQTGTLKRAAIENMAAAFTRKGSTSEPVSFAVVENLQCKIGRRVVERDFLADASQQLFGTRCKYGELGSQVKIRGIQR